MPIMMSATDVVEIIDEFELAGVDVWIDGGWGVDALLGEQTRHHEDLDIVIQQSDVIKLCELLEAKGCKEVKLEIARPFNFVFGDKKNHEIDIHVIVFDNEGNGIYGPAEDGEIYPASALGGVGGMIEGKAVKCTSPEWMVQTHTGYELGKTDLHDVVALCRKFNIAYPEEDTRLKNSRSLNL